MPSWRRRSSTTGPTRSPRRRLTLQKQAFPCAEPGIIRAMRIAALVFLACVCAAPAAATPQSDFNAVYGDWKKDQVITPCAWSQAQLQNAYDVARSNPDFQYETGFVDDTQAEMNRWKTG